MAPVPTCLRLLPLLSLSIVSMAAAAADSQTDDEPLAQLVVTATRAPAGVALQDLGSAVTVLQAQQLRTRQVRMLTDVLRDVPGVAVSQAGPGGSVTQVRLRGTESNHVLVMVDGMDVSDPFFGEFDFAGLVADDAARVEVLRGQQGALYGTDAIGGVIHYISLSGREAPGVSGRLEGGAFGTADAAARWAGVDGALDYALSGGLRHSDGSPSSRSGTRKLGQENQNLSGRFAWEANDALQLRAVLRWARSQVEFNQQDFNWGSPTYGTVIDSDDRSDTRRLQGLIAADWRTVPGLWTQSLSVQGMQAERESQAQGLRSGASRGIRVKGSYVSTLQWQGLGAAQQLVMLADVNQERMQNLQPDSSLEQGQLHQLHTQGMAVQYRLLWSDQVAVAAALRHDQNERFADADTAQLQASWHVTKALRLRAAAGSGIKNPTTTELFGYDPLTFVGNPSLRPEYSRGWEVALEHSALQGRVLTGIGWSQSRLRDEIYTVYSPSFVASPANRSSVSRQRMLELYGQARLDGGWSVDASYGHLSARENNIAEVRRPPQVGSVSVAWQGASTGLHATLRYNGSTNDYNFTDKGPPIVRLGGYSLLQLGGQWRITPRWEVFGRLENALGAQYEDVYTYRMPGRAAYFGIRSAL